MRRENAFTAGTKVSACSLKHRKSPPDSLFLSLSFSFSRIHDASRILLGNELIPLTSSREIIDNVTNVGEFHESSCFQRDQNF